MEDSLLTFESPYLLIVAALVGGAVVAIGFRRRISIPKASTWLAIIGLLLIVLSAGSPNWRRPVAREVAVLVDLSASTRTAAYRDWAELDRRTRELLGDTPFRLFGFADGTPVSIDRAFDLKADLPSQRTHLEVPPAAAVLLFSDGQFVLPASAPPVYTAVDPNLSRTVDGQITDLSLDARDAIASVVTATPRALQWSGVAASLEGSTVQLSPGKVVVRQPRISDGNGMIEVRLSAADAWPENDALQLIPPPPRQAERWFVTDRGAAPVGFRAMKSADLPAETSAYLAASVVVLDNLPAAALSAVQQERLATFVRDAGGGLIILGGDRAFAAGGYVGTALEALSPLASVPPRPATHWILLTDGSGSMNADAGGRSKWQLAAGALVQLLPALPPDDPVDLGSFAADVSWWTSNRSAKEAKSLPLPPAGLTPGGPTNLRPALEAAAQRHDKSLPGKLLLISDADAEVGEVQTLVDSLKSRQIELHLLAVGDGRGLGDLTQVVQQTGGKTVRQADAARWAEAAAELLQSAGDKQLRTMPAAVTFVDRLQSLPLRAVTPWNRTWLKPRATAWGQTREVGETIAVAGGWQVGEGRVAAAAFSVAVTELAALANAVAAPPRDPRFSITTSTKGQLKVRVDAVDSRPDAAEPFLNGLTLTLQLSNEMGGVQTLPLNQTAPGRYEVVLPAPQKPVLAVVRNGNQQIERFAVAGRYAQEFDQIGINRQTLQSLADRFGGRVIEPNETKPIDFRWPRQKIPMRSWLAIAGAVFLSAALLWWRWA